MGAKRPFLQGRAGGKSGGGLGGGSPHPFPPVLHPLAGGGQNQNYTPQTAKEPQKLTKNNGKSTDETGETKDKRDINTDIKPQKY